jgi:hypothetical protein
MNDVGWLFLYILGGLPGGAMVLYACTEPGLFDWRWFLVGLVLVTYFWWPAWIQLARYGRPKKMAKRQRPTRLTREQRRNYPYI